MKRLAITLSFLLAVAGPAAAAQAAPRPALRLTPLGNISFPDRAFVLSSAKPVALASSNVHVREDGQAVKGLSVIPATATTSRGFGVVLVLDASASMRGAPIKGAVAAARIFLAHRGAGEAIGLITFNQTIDVVSPVTTNQSRISGLLSSIPEVAVGTRLWDATAKAIQLLRAAHITAGSVVLLTDGTDTGSTLARSKLVAEARSGGIRLFAVGLHSAQFAPGSLATVARDTNGAFSQAVSPKSLAGIYGSLAQQLANEYLLRYHSDAGPGKAIRVDVSVDGLSAAASSTYQTPGLPANASPPYQKSTFDRLISSSASVLLIVLIVALLVALAVSAVLKPRRSTLRSRVGEFVSMTEAETSRLPMADRLFRPLASGFERGVQKAKWFERLSEELEIAQFPIKPTRLVAATLSASVVLALLGVFSPVLVLLALLPPIVVRAMYKGRLSRRRHAFEEQLPDNLTVMAASLRAGHSFVMGLNAVVDQADEPSRSELRRAVADEQLGVQIEDGLMAVARRMACEDLEQVALVAALQRQTGGNTAEVLDAVARSVRERFQLRRLVRALTAQGRLARVILTALPVLVGGWIAIVNPHYMSPLLHTGVGQAILTVAIVMILLGGWVVKKITEIEI